MTTAVMPSLTSRIASDAVPTIRTVKLSKSIDARRVLDGLDLLISAGEYVAVLGANGAGKSTLLRLLATLIPPTSGDIYLFGEKLVRNSFEIRSKLSLISHQSMLYRDLSARENLEFFGQLFRVANPGQRAAELLDMVGLSGRADEPVKAFSRGMVQRVAIARALVHEPQLLLADEPFDGLDAASVTALEHVLSDLNAAGTTIVLVNHDVEQSLTLAGRAVVLRDGRVALDQPTLRLYPQEVLSEVCAV